MPHTRNKVAESVSRTRQNLGGEDRRAVGANPARTGLIIEADPGNSSDLLIGFGPSEVTPESYSLRLPPGAGFRELGPSITPKNEVRIASAGSGGAAHVTAFSGGPGLDSTAE